MIKKDHSLNGLVLFLILSLSISKGFCQGNQVQNPNIRLNISESLDAYDLFKGGYYQYKPSAGLTHPYFLNKQWIQGNITHRGQQIDSVNLLYDLVDDLLVVSRNQIISSENYGYIPYQNQIEVFNLEGYTFKYLNEPEINNSGYYEVLFEGSILSMVRKHWKDKKVDDGRFAYKDRSQTFFKYGEHLYIPIYSLNQLKKVFPEQKKAIKKVIKAQGLKSNIRKLGRAEISRLLPELEKLIK
jgi:hypothetical protein